MKHDEALKLIELMIQMGFDSETIMRTLFHCGLGKSIGVAYYDGLVERMNMQNRNDSNEQ